MHQAVEEGIIALSTWTLNFEKMNAKSELKVGDIVILRNDSVSWNFWKLAKIETLLPGKHGVTRAVMARTCGEHRAYMANSWSASKYMISEKYIRQYDKSFSINSS